MTRAIDIGIRRDDPTRDVKAIRIKSGGHHSWTDLEISQFERCHAIGSRARLALALLLYTGQRRGDVIRMEAQRVRGGILYVKQEKCDRACYPDASGSRGRYCRNAKRSSDAPDDDDRRPVRGYDLRPLVTARIM
jgi:integrase